jgi:hypothetical protein
MKTQRSMLTKAVLPVLIGLGSLVLGCDDNTVTGKYGEKFSTNGDTISANLVFGTVQKDENGNRVGRAHSVSSYTEFITPYLARDGDTYNTLTSTKNVTRREEMTPEMKTSADSTLTVGPTYWLMSQAGIDGAFSYESIKTLKEKARIGTTVNSIEGDN